MSGLEQRTKGLSETLADAAAVTAVATDWPAIDGDLLEERRATVPAFPLELLASPWREWVSAAAQSADVPVDYVAQALLAAVAGVSSNRALVCFRSGWLEPLYLWLAVVGAPSSGKSPALRLVGHLVSALESNSIEGLAPPPRQIRLDQKSVAGVVAAVNKAEHGVLLWRDGPGGCFAPLRGMPDARHLEDYAITLLGSVEPWTVSRALPAGGEGLAARFLYAWPHAAPFRSLAERKHASGADLVARLQRLLPLGTREHFILMFDTASESVFDGFLSRLHAEIRQADGLEAAWLGKGRGAVVCLAATFALMEWSGTDAAELPERLTIGLGAVESAIALWSDYYRPHARAFIHNAVPSDLDGQVRRVVRWLRAESRSVVSRTEVRRMALGRTVDARAAERVAERLVEAGVLRALAGEKRAQGGRPALRWAVNPMLVAH